MRRHQNDALFTPFRPYRWREAGPPPDAFDEPSGHIPEAKIKPEEP